jgi:hypothetical protein
MNKLLIYSSVHKYDFNTLKSLFKKITKTTNWGVVEKHPRFRENHSKRDEIHEK